MTGNILLKCKKKMMSLFKKIVESVLLEDVQISKINDAISNTYEVKINYHSDTDSASGERIIQPVAYGVSKSGNLLLRAYQPFGDTQSSVPSWKLFSVSGIKKWKPLQNRVFTKPEGFNSNGDKKMSIVYSIANFNNSSTERASKQLKPVKASGPVTKASLMNNFKKNEVNKKDQKTLDNSQGYSDIIKNNTTNIITQKNGGNLNSHMVAGSGPVAKDSFKSNINDKLNNSEDNNIIKKETK